MKKQANNTACTYVAARVDFPLQGASEGIGAEREYLRWSDWPSIKSK